MRWLLWIALLAACRGTPSRLPLDAPKHAYCDSTCWNDSYCRGQGIACERCVGGVCSGSSLVAELDQHQERCP